MCIDGMYLVILDFVASKEQAKYTKNRITMESMADIIFDRSFNLLRPYLHCLVTTDMNNETQKQRFIQETIDFVGVGIFYISRYPDSDEIFNIFKLIHFETSNIILELSPTSNRAYSTLIGT